MREESRIRVCEQVQQQQAHAYGWRASAKYRLQ